MDFALGEWETAVTVLAVGLTVGGLIIVGLSKSGSSRAEVESAGRVDDLKQTQTQTVEALRSLELQRRKLSDAEYQRQRQALLTKGAGALRALDEPVADDGVDDLPAGLSARDRALLLEARAREVQREHRHGKRNRIVGGLFLVALLLMVLSLVAKEDATPRREDEVSQMVPPSQIADENELQAKLAADPNDMDALNASTELAIVREDLQSAMDFNGRALQVDPTNADAQVHRAALNVAIGQGSKALEILAEVLVKEPNHTRALVYQGLLSLQTQNYPLAVSSLERALAGGAAGDPYLIERLAEARRLLGGATPDVVKGSDAAGSLVSGTIDVSPEVRAKLKGTEVLFISIKDATSAAPRPLAAIRMAPTFPATFTITHNDLVMRTAGQALPQKYSVKAKIDGDGNAMTHDDVVGQLVIDSVETGTSGVEIILVP